MSAREKNRDFRYLRIKEMYRFLSKERRLASDFCSEVICAFFAIEDQTIMMALKAEVKATPGVAKCFEMDKKWLEAYVRLAIAGKQERKEEKGLNTLF
jgi:hypothetical protein